MLPGDMQIVGLECDLNCEQMIVITAKRRGADSRAIIGGSNREWLSLTDEKGVPFTFLSGMAGHRLIASRGNQVVEIDTRTRSYGILYTHPSIVFLPTVTGDDLLFSDSAAFVPGRANPYYRRRLFRYKLSTGERKRLLQPWEAYRIGAATRAGDGMWCLNLALPSIEPARRPPNAPDPTLGDPEAYCFDESVLVQENTSAELIRKAALPGPAGHFYSLSIDQPRGYAAGWDIDGGAPTWRIVDLKSGKVLRSMGTHTDRLTVAPSGDRYVFASPAFGGSIRGTIHDIRTGAALKRFTIHSWKVETVALQPRR